MNPDRRKFLQMLAAVCGSGVARTMGGLGAGAIAVASGTTAVAATATAATAATVAAGAYGAGVRSQVFEVIVRQALAGAPWQEICKGPMAVNKISVEDVQAEVNRRKNFKHKEGERCLCETCVKERVQRHRNAMNRIEKIAHSDKSPCACKTCRQAVNSILAEHWQAEFPRKAGQLFDDYV